VAYGISNNSEFDLSLNKLNNLYFTFIIITFGETKGQKDWFN